MLYEPSEFDENDTQEIPTSYDADPDDLDDFIEAVRRGKRLQKALGVENCPKCGLYLYDDLTRDFLTQCPGCFSCVDDWEIMLTGKSSLVEEVVKELYPDPLTEELEIEALSIERCFEVSSYGRQ